jgi:pantetheine-phosphate adenylyltransferase
MRIAIYPGSFDPVTNGHLDIARRGLQLFDRVIISVSENSQKKAHFSVPERVRFLKEALKANRGISVEHFSGLVAEYAKRKKACAVIRGLRAVSDFEYEFQMALMNRRQNPSFETVFLMPDERYTYLSSNMIREVSRLGGKVRGLVPPSVEKALLKRAPRSDGRQALTSF